MAKQKNTETVKDDAEQKSESSINQEASLTAATVDIAEPEINAGTVTVERLTPPEAVDVHAGLTKIKIEYPEDFTGNKYFKEGEIKSVSEEVADQLVNAGIATKV